MKRFIGLLLLVCSRPVLAQHHYTLLVLHDETRQPLPGVTIRIQPVNATVVSDSTGRAFLPALGPGNYTLQCTCIGFREREVALKIPLRVSLPLPVSPPVKAAVKLPLKVASELEPKTAAELTLKAAPELEPKAAAGGQDSSLTVTLEPMVETMQDVVVSSTRTNQLVKNTPLAVQVIDREDIEEGTAQSPANIRELLTELSGTQMQQTSAVSGNVSIRLQGLDGRYTQLLKDGFPLYGGFSGSLSILQIPPLDLRQVEVIKGAGSALYGGDAIAGIINLISRSPDNALHLDAVGNQTNRGGTDLAGFYSQRGKRMGVTVLATGSRQQPMDINNDGFTDVPRVRQGTVAPTLFWYPDDSTTVRLGAAVSTENRSGGDLRAAVHDTPPPDRS